MRQAKIVVTFAILALLAIPLAPALGDATSSHNFAENVWANNQIYGMIAPPSRFPMPTNPNGQEDFYELAPQVPSLAFPSSPQSNDCTHLGIIPGTNNIPCWHDHVVPAPAHNQGSFSAVWHVYLILCTPDGISNHYCTPEVVSGTLLTGGSVTLPLVMNATNPNTGTPLGPLTSTTAINNALNLINPATNQPIMVEVDTGVSFVCTVVPLN